MYFLETVITLVTFSKQAPKQPIISELVAYLLISELTMAYPVCFVCLSDRCQEAGNEERRKERRDEKCPFLENSGSEEDVLQILQYMATILGKLCKGKLSLWFVSVVFSLFILLFVHPREFIPQKHT